jgi:alpha-tubulin suppressor-like RCC1 family protein
MIRIGAGGRRLLRTSVCMGLVGVTLAACGGGGTTTAPPVASKLAFTVQPTNATAGVALAPAVVVTIEDESGHPVTNATNTVTASIETNAGGGTLSGTTTVPAVGGVATFGNLSIQKAGTGYTLTAISGTLTSAISAAFTIGPAVPAQLAFTQEPSNTQQGQAITPSVQVAIQDAFANTVSSATNAVTLAIGTNPAGGTLTGTTTANAVSGTATFANLSINQPGSGYTLAATASGLTGITSGAFGIALTFASVSAGYEHTCAITPAGAAYCWGLNNIGQLGNGTNTGPDQCQGAPCSLAPVAVSGGVSFATVSAGSYYTCGVTTAHAAYCWGTGGSWLGNGGTTNAMTPVAVSGGLSFAMVSAGYEHTCGVTTTGAAYCWGTNPNGELGNGTTVDSATPVAVSGGLTFAAVTGGGSAFNDGFTCGLTTGGAAYCWGDNTVGELGDSTTTNRTTPVAVSGGLAFAAVSAGGGPHTCGVTSAGAAYCWGDNSAGELGNNTGTNSTTPVAVSGGLTFATTSARNGHSCGITRAGAGYCWGLNSQGQLGNGTIGPFQCGVLGYPCSPTPASVVGGLAFSGVSTGWFHTCGVSTAGAAYCWGYNGYGDLGYGTSTLTNLSPGAVSPP